MADPSFDWYYMTAEIAIQYDLFNEITETECLRQEIHAVKKSSDSVRRGVFQRLNTQGKHVIELEDKLRQLERRLELLEKNL